MKVEYFVVVFCLLFGGAYFTYMQHRPGAAHESNMVISSGNSYEEIKYSGSIHFNDDETAIASISPNGYIIYEKNDHRLSVTSDKQGIIKYEIQKNNASVPLDSNGQKLVTEAISEMIAWGINADERMARIYSKGGNMALMNELAHLKSDYVKRIYLERIFKSDTLSNESLVAIAQQTATAIENDGDKTTLLLKFKPAKLTDSAVAIAYLKATATINADYEKINALKNILALPLHSETFTQIFEEVKRVDDESQRSELLTLIINKGQMDESRADQLLAAIDSVRADYQKDNLITLWINKGTIPSSRINKMLEIINHSGSDMDKEGLYTRLMAASIKTGDQWVSLLDKAGLMQDENQKTNLLLQIAQRMPRADSLKTAFLKIAKTVGSDPEYGKLVRAVD